MKSARSKTSQSNLKDLIQTTINLDRRWIELLDYQRDGYDFQGAN